MSWALLLACQVASLLPAALASPDLVSVRPSADLQRGSLASLHFGWLSSEAFTHSAERHDDAHYSVTHGLCDESFQQALAKFSGKPERLAWVVPEDIVEQGCLFVQHRGSEGEEPHIVGRSSAFNVAQPRKFKRAADFQEENPLLKDFESLGAWFDGVAAIRAKTNSDGAVVSRSKNTSIGIVGAGVAGLATGLMLDSVGLRNWHIIEASDKVGGRFRSRYVGPTKEIAEMGPMRLPYTVKYDDGEVLPYTDHQLTFQLFDWLNDLNKNASDYKIDLIDWIQHSPNELLARGTGRLANGRIPTRADIAANASLAQPKPLDTKAYNDTKSRMNDILLDKARLKSIQRDVWRAHKLAMDQGFDDWSEQAFMRHVFKASENVTDAIWTSSDYDVFWDEMHHNSNLGLSGGPGALGETQWKAVAQGFSRIGEAFIPHVQDRLTLNRQVRKLENIGNRTRISWYPSEANRTFESAEFDYTIMAAPFTMTRFMDLPPFSSVLSRAISEAGLRFKSACKVGLLFRERFWEKGDRPIFGGYSQPSSNAVGALYYPIFNLNQTRPGLILHYRGGDWSDRMVALTDEEHVGLVLDSIVELHGQQARELYTGDYERLCWLSDRFTATSWTRPDIEQHKLYIPSYHVTEHNTIFIGEHTAPTHAWISSSLHSSVRGTIQLLLELGLVDEAKQLNKQWMGRWIRL
ncbi:l-amino acid oxidase [Ceraceosorus bombacis]|uniref:L-amino acid oxidase n=1 Tax=Ceraceosorus bombacis TaxID=401625 RepID=A0A0P1BSU3_9BASI|nr:l-amino acid oxidase [Ceraceosorus bombacis]